MSKKPIEFERVDEEYETRMAGFEVDCNEGRGNAMACHQVGEFYSVVKSDHIRAANVYEKNCTDKNYAASCFNLGRFFLGGRGVPQNDDKAEELFDKSCKLGHDYACYNQATLMYLQARDILASNEPVSPEVKTAATKRYADAIDLYSATCEKGELDSCYMAATVMIDQESIARNPLKAKEFFEKSCIGGHAPSCYNLAVMFKKGDVGILPDPEKFEIYKVKTEELVKLTGLTGKKIG